MNSRPVAALAPIILAALTTACAPTLIAYDNGPPGLDAHTTSDLGHDLSVAADDFTLPPGKTRISEVIWYGGYVTGGRRAEDDFWIRIFEDDDGSPAPSPTVLDLRVGHVFRARVEPDINQPAVFRYMTPIDPVTLRPDTTYYLSIANYRRVNMQPWAWNASTADTGKIWTRRDDTGPWERGGTAGRAFALVFE